MVVAVAVVSSKGIGNFLELHEYVRTQAAVVLASCHGIKFVDLVLDVHVSVFVLNVTDVTTTQIRSGLLHRQGRYTRQFSSVTNEVKLSWTSQIIVTGGESCVAGAVKRTFINTFRTHSNPAVNNQITLNK